MAVITEIVGKRACGKTLLAVKYAQDALAAGKSVWANFTIQGCQFFRDWAEIPLCYVGVVIFDAADAHAYDLKEGWSSKTGEGTLLSHLAAADLVLVYQYPQSIQQGLAQQHKSPAMDGDVLVIDGERIDARPLYRLYDTCRPAIQIWAPGVRERLLEGL